MLEKKFNLHQPWNRSHRADIPPKDLLRQSDCCSDTILHTGKPRAHEMSRQTKEQAIPNILCRRRSEADLWDEIFVQFFSHLHGKRLMIIKVRLIATRNNSCVVIRIVEKFVDAVWWWLDVWKINDSIKVSWWLSNWNFYSATDVRMLQRHNSIEMTKHSINY